MIQYAISKTCAISFVLGALLLAGAAHAQRGSRAPAEKAAPPDKAPPAERVANFRPIGPAATTPAVIPPVLLSKEHQALCQIKVGDTMPAISLNQLGGRQTELAKLYGKSATVIAFWKAENRMSRTLLADLAADVVEPFGQRGVAVVGIAVEAPAAAATSALERAAARFPNLLDADGKAFAQIGKEKLPRVYLLDPQGKVRWFDIEYSLATRRELNQALRAAIAPAGARQE